LCRIASFFQLFVFAEFGDAWQRSGYIHNEGSHDSAQRQQGNARRNLYVDHNRIVWKPEAYSDGVVNRELMIDSHQPQTA
jgi:hypothetical protein